MSSRRSKPTTPEEIEQEIAGLLAAESGRHYTHLRRLQRADYAQAVSALAAALERQTDAFGYGRIATALARLGGEAALQVLSTAARGDLYPRTAVRALGYSSDPLAVGILADLVAAGKARVRASAVRALAATKSDLAVEPLLGARAYKNIVLRSAANEALSKLGRPPELVRRLVRLPRMAAYRKAALVDALAETGRGWFRLDPQKQLDKDAADLQYAFRQESADVAEAYRARKTLLRASDRSDESTLVRAVGPPVAATDTLVRASDVSEVPDAEASRGAGLLARIRRLVAGGDG